jgi:hypothetical protein
MTKVVSQFKNVNTNGSSCENYQWSKLGSNDRYWFRVVVLGIIFDGAPSCVLLKMLYRQTKAQFCDIFRHRCARLLKQQNSITVYCLPTKGNKLPFSVFVCSKQTEVCRFRFLFAANKRKLPFSVFPLVPFCVYVWVRGVYCMSVSVSPTAMIVYMENTGFVYPACL